MKNQVLDQSRASEHGAFRRELGPFRIEIPQAQLEDLSDRLARAGEPSNVGPAQATTFGLLRCSYGYGNPCARELRGFCRRPG